MQTSTRVITRRMTRALIHRPGARKLTLDLSSACTSLPVSLLSRVWAYIAVGRGTWTAVVPRDVTRRRGAGCMCVKCVSNRSARRSRV